MTPLEINKKIAEMQGFKVIYIPDFDWQAYEETRMPITNYAEHISDAWELFEEMPNPKLQLFNRDDAGMVRFPWRVKIDFNKDMEFLGSTAQLAICKAWLAWKENEK